MIVHSRSSTVRLVAERPIDKNGTVSESNTGCAAQQLFLDLGSPAEPMAPRNQSLWIHQSGTGRKLTHAWHFLQEHIQRNFSLPGSACTYGDGFTGSNRLRAAIASTLNRYLYPLTPIHPDHVLVTNGCSSALEQLSWAIANPGDGFLLGRP